MDIDTGKPIPNTTQKATSLDCRKYRKLFKPKSDQYLISPNSNTAKSFMGIGLKELIINLKEALIDKQILPVSTKGNV